MWKCPNRRIINDGNDEFCKRCGMKIHPERFYFDEEECYWNEEYREENFQDVNLGLVGEHYG